MKSIFAVCAFVFTALAATPLYAADNNENGIKGVVTAFGQAIMQRDKPAFLKLFVNPTVTWQAVLSDATVAQLRVKHPNVVKAEYQQNLNAETFIDGVVADKKSSEETFSNMRIDSDGDVAAVTFDYTFLSAGQKSNWGKECWLLVRTSAGWKITTLAYSIVLAG